MFNEQHVDIAEFPMIEDVIIVAKDSDVYVSRSTDSIIASIKLFFDMCGPFNTAKKFGKLKNNSGEDFAMQWMSFYNKYTGKQIY